MAEKNLLVLVGLFLGIMVCVDMGGPINKIAYVVGTLAITPANQGGFSHVDAAGNMTTAPIMSAVMLSGMMPPLAIAFSTLVFRKA